MTVVKFPKDVSAGGYCFQAARSWLCKFKWHHWAKWQTIDRRRFKDTQRPYLVQERICLSCGLEERKIMGYEWKPEG